MTVVAATMADKARVKSILLDAFSDDPMMNWLSHRPQFQPVFFDMMLAAFMPAGCSYATDDERGAAVWLPAGVQLRWPINPAIVVRFMRAAGLAGVRRALTTGNVTQKHRTIICSPLVRCSQPAARV